MAKGLKKSLQRCISKLKKTTRHPQKPSNLLPFISWLLSACKNLKTSSFTVDRYKSDGNDFAATLTDIDRFLAENFSSLYADDNDGNKEYDTDVFASESESPPMFDKTPPNLRSSQRFFVSPGTSNSLVEEEAQPSASPSSSSSDGLPIDSVAVLTVTMDPYDKFRWSMQEMMEAHQMGQRQPLDWDFLKELLFCYLNLNEKRAHKYILAAFVDILVSFYQKSDRSPTP